ncbi:unnamed protein product [Commensalibacter communis]|uniref:DUF2806 domain-containing protein n=1 Tax=Commensalibacter communis TaxID=2972786 RepID=UPI0022FFB746|nr:DUF2806 domain-containing protein [Commensalibacter communis]CAI3925848.1 unnamed protein product [Commensalibacter communis]
MLYSKLLEQIWLTLDKSGGAFFRPWIIVRDGKAKLKLETLEKLMAAQTEKRINLLKQDTTNTTIDINALERLVMQDLATIDVEEKEKREPYLECAKYIHNNITENIVRRELRKEVNFAKAVGIAADILSQDQSDPPTEQVEQDWIDRFREVASNTTTEEIQQLWGRILAGEIKSPGKHSLRTLDFIRNLSQKEAQQIEKLFSFVIGGNGIFNRWDERYNAFQTDVLQSKLSLDYLYDMQSLGIITGVGFDQSMFIFPNYDQDVKYYRISFRNYNCLCESYIFKHDDDQDILFYGYKLTKLGEELYDLCSFETNSDYLNYIIKSLEEQGFKKVPQNEIKFDFK